MADRLHQELLAVPALSQLTQSQLRELPWRTKEQVLIALFQEHASSVDAADALKTCARDRKLERRVEKSESADREAIRKREDAFRSDFMQIAATELARLGAPAMVTWQKLVFDKDCVAQAFRLLLTRIKSSQRALAAAAKQQQHASDAPEDDDGNDDRDVATRQSSQPSHPVRPRVHFHTKLRATVRTSSSPTPSSQADLDARSNSWDFDLSTSAADCALRSSSSSSNNNNNNSRAEIATTNDCITINSDRAELLPSLVAGARIERRASAAKHHASSATRQLQTLQSENTALAAENKRLQDDIAHLEALNASLQNDLVRPTAATDLDARRMQLVQAQNVQLQRQLELQQNAVADMQQVTANLLVALHRWRSVIDTGVQEAAAAGADASARTASGKSAKWMLAAPDALMAELTRVEAQIHSASAAASHAAEAKLRVRSASSAFLRCATTSVRASDVVRSDSVSGIGSHLRLDRVKVLERKLARLCVTLDAFAADALESNGPRMQIDAVGRSSSCGLPTAPALADAARALLLEVGALGAVVSTGSVADAAINSDAAGDDAQQLTVTPTHVLRALAASSTSNTSNKERDRTLKPMLQQLQTQYTAMANDVHACRRETQYWRTAWRTQEEIVSALTRRVARLGATKMQWCDANVSAPLAQLVHVFTSFEHAQLDGSVRQNPYLPALVETLASHLGVLTDALHQWRAYVEATDAQLAALVDDYEANRVVLEQQQQQHVVCAS